VTTVFFGGWVFWYFAIRPPAVHRPTHYNLFEIGLLPTGLTVAGVLLLLAAAGAFTGKVLDGPAYRDGGHTRRTRTGAIPGLEPMYIASWPGAFAVPSDPAVNTMSPG
jgi:hypothetical protein